LRKKDYVRRPDKGEQSCNVDQMVRLTNGREKKKRGTTGTLEEAVTLGGDQ